MTPDLVSYSCSPAGGAAFIEITKKHYQTSCAYRITVTCPVGISHPLIDEIEGYVERHPEYTLSLKLSDTEYLARTAWGMGRDGGPDLVRAFCWVILNRLSGSYGDTMQEVCQRPGEFSCWLPNSPLRAAMVQAHKEDGGDFAHALEIAADVLDQSNFSDPTGGATHFCECAHLANVQDPVGIRIIAKMAFYQHQAPL